MSTCLWHRGETDTTAGASPDNPHKIRFHSNHRSLRDELRDSLESIGIDPQGSYLPEEKFEKLFTKSAVREALDSTSEDDPLVAYAIGAAQCTFATLVLLFTQSKDLRQAMKALRANNFEDIDLEQDIHSVWLFLYPDHEIRLCSSCGTGCSHCFPGNLQPWDSQLLDDFKLKRWKFLVPEFTTNIFMYEFNEHQLLPFQPTNEPPGGGHFSEVTCVQIVKNKIDNNPEPILVALKKLKRINHKDFNIEGEWRREAKAHKQLNQKRPHLIKAYAAYKRTGSKKKDTSYYIILEWANGGSLHSFWNQNPEAQVLHTKVEESRQRVRDVLKQLVGLADALEGMHATPVPSEQNNGSSSRSSPMHSPMSNPQKGKDIPSIEGPQVLNLHKDNSTRDTSNRESNRGPIVSGLSVPQLNYGNSPIDNIPMKRSVSDHGQPNWRHGDIKPENILRFKENKENTNDKSVGTWKLADLGRAQMQRQVTSRRETKEQEKWRTRWYEPPDLEEDMHRQAGGRISRLFDIWSMGCVIFETILWLLHGYGSVGEFLNASGLRTGDTNATPYWKKNDKGYQVNDVITNWVKDILQKDPERDGAIGDLLRLTQKKLLIIPLPPDSDTYTSGCRTNAKDLKEELDKIFSKAQGNDLYAYSGGDRTGVTLPETYQAVVTRHTPQSSAGSSLSPFDIPKLGQAIRQGQRTAIAWRREYTNSLDDSWRITTDDTLFKEHLVDRHFSTPELCEYCKRINVDSDNISFNMEMLADSDDCDICQLVYHRAKTISLLDTENLKLTKYGNVLYQGQLKEHQFLRWCHTDSTTAEETKVPAGVPDLLCQREVPTVEDVKLLKAWLDECDSKHTKSCAPNNSELSLPDRLIDIRSVKKQKIITTEELSKDTKYVALSHRWGDMPEEAVTTPVNIANRMKRSIPTEELTQNFRDAIAITAVLGIKYLWIDSLCILQGPQGDFNEQADKMQTTFSGAYCVLAACSAKESNRGFLKKELYPSVKVGDFYLSPVTNDFERDVLNSPLNSRGWVLQERALARRTIFFTDTQIYWECGDGIRSETLARLKNDREALLSDAKFPSYTIRSDGSRGKQIVLWTDLFQKYTRLEFSHHKDRPIAIDSLMGPLSEAFKTRSLAGVFETFWGRCLLWQRADDTDSLKKISASDPPSRCPPTWSWMAYQGAITFMSIEGDSLDWNGKVELPPALSDGKRKQTSWLRTSRSEENLVINAMGFKIIRNDGIVYDDGNASVAELTKCVIIGIEKGSDHAASKWHYVLVVQEKNIDAEGNIYCERVGAGCLKGESIALDDQPTLMLLE